MVDEALDREVRRAEHVAWGAAFLSGVVVGTVGIWTLLGAVAPVAAVVAALAWHGALAALMAVAFRARGRRLRAAREAAERQAAAPRERELAAAEREVARAEAALEATDDDPVLRN